MKPVIVVFVALAIFGCSSERWRCNNCGAQYEMPQPHLPKATFIQCPECGEIRLRRVTNR